MSECHGRIPVTAKVDAEMRDLLDEDADRLGVHRSELIRRVLDNYAAARNDELECPSCGAGLDYDL